MPAIATRGNVRGAQGLAAARHEPQQSFSREAAGGFSMENDLKAEAQLLSQLNSNNNAGWAQQMEMDASMSHKIAFDIAQQSYNDEMEYYAQPAAALQLARSSGTARLAVSKVSAFTPGFITDKSVVVRGALELEEESTSAQDFNVMTDDVCAWVTKETRRSPSTFAPPPPPNVERMRMANVECSEETARKLTERWFGLTIRQGMQYGLMSIDLCPTIDSCSGDATYWNQACNMWWASNVRGRPSKMTAMRGEGNAQPKKQRAYRNTPYSFSCSAELCLREAPVRTVGGYMNTYFRNPHQQAGIDASQEEQLVSKHKNCSTFPVPPPPTYQQLTNVLMSKEIAMSTLLRYYQRTCIALTSQYHVAPPPTEGRGVADWSRCLTRWWELHFGPESRGRYNTVSKHTKPSRVTAWDTQSFIKKQNVDGAIIMERALADGNQCKYEIRTGETLSDTTSSSNGTSQSSNARVSVLIHANETPSHNGYW